MSIVTLGDPLNLCIWHTDFWSCVGIRDSARGQKYKLPDIYYEWLSLTTSSLHTLDLFLLPFSVRSHPNFLTAAWLPKASLSHPRPLSSKQWEKDSGAPMNKHELLNVSYAQGDKTKLRISAEKWKFFLLKRANGSSGTENTISQIKNSMGGFKRKLVNQNIQGKSKA